MLIKLRKILLFHDKDAMNIPATKIHCYLTLMSLPDTFPSALCTALHSLHCLLDPRHPPPRGVFICSTVIGKT